MDCMKIMELVIVESILEVHRRKLSLCSLFLEGECPLIVLS